MGRRSVHTPEELRRLILDASEGIIERNGLIGLSAREIARIIGYSPGTLYNIFQNLDDVLMTLQAQLMSRAAEHVRAVPIGADGAANLAAVSEAYVEFALANRRMWNLFLAHMLPPQGSMPQSFHEAVNGLVEVVVTAVKPLATGRSAESVDSLARTFLASIYGITTVAATEKGVYLTPATAKAYAKELTDTFVKGLSQPEREPA